jgi:rhomboid family protein
MLAIPLYDDNPSTRIPIITYGLITACTLVFLWQVDLDARLGHDVTLEYGMIPAVLFGYHELPARLQRIPAWASLFTSTFMHGGWLHLIGNMLYLWIFGKGVETTLGPLRFLVFYFISGAAAGLTQAFIDPSVNVPVIGASGAIAGTLGAYLVLHPRGNVVVFVWLFVFLRFITVPAVILLGLWFLLQLMSALSATPGDPGVAFGAHVGGFIAGMLLVMVFRPQGVRMLQPSRTASFSVSRQRGRFGAGSVPPAGRRRDPWR